MNSPGIPISVQIATNLKSAAILNKQLGISGTASAISRLLGNQLRGEPFGHLPPPEDWQEEQSRKQIAPAILLYRSLIYQLGQYEALKLTRSVILEGTLIFLGNTIGSLEREQIEAMSSMEREAFLQSIGNKFFNADLSWEEFSPEKVSFKVTHCRFPKLCAQAGAEELAPLMCEGDRLFFGQIIKGVELVRPKTIAEGADTCDFCLQWKDEDGSA